MNFNDQILNYAKASYPLLIINTHEEKRVVKDLMGILSKREDFGTFYKWECITGLVPLNKNNTLTEKKFDDAGDLFEHLLKSSITGKEKRNAYVLCDFHLELESKMKAKEYIRYIKNLANYLRRDGSTMIFVQPHLDIPTELEKEVQVVEYALPDEKAIKAKLEDNLISTNNARKAKSKEAIKLSSDFIENVVEASKGMTASEVDSAMAFASVSTGGEFNDEYTDLVFGEKIAQIKKNSLLTYIETDISFDNVGGLDGIKSWINIRKKAFTKEAQEYGIASPRGIILCGFPGAGKSFISKAISNEFKVPLFGLDLGRLYGSKVGESEGNVREVIKTIDSIGKCTIMLDEIEKSLNTNATSGAGDSGTSSRLFGTLLTYLSDRTGASLPFLIGTCNNIGILPPELLRPGRFDCCFWIDLPTVEERKDIFKVLLQKYKRDPKKFKIGELAKLTENYVGAEIEELIKSALFRSFNNDRELMDADIIQEIKKFKCDANANPDKVLRMREAAKGKLKIAGKDGEVVDDVETSLRSLEI